MGLTGQTIGTAQVFLTNFDRGGVEFDRILAFPLLAREMERPEFRRNFSGLSVSAKNMSASCIFSLHT
jgi:hypothetical protein